MANEVDPNQKRTRVVAAALAGVVSVAAVAGALLLFTGDDASDSTPPEWADGPVPSEAVALTTADENQLKAAAEQAGCKLNKNRNEGSTHKDDSTDFKYKAVPATSGDHTQTWAIDGAYRNSDWSTPYLVHALEHGRVYYQWDDAKLTDQQIGSLKKLYDDDPYHLIISPDTSGMPYAIAATSWDRSLTCEEMNDDVFAAMRLFRLSYIDQAPEQVP